MSVPTATGGTGATERGDINLVGSRIIASQNLTLRADRDITLTAAVGRDTESTKRTSSAASVGISFGVGGPQSGFAVTLAASRSNAWSNGWGTTFWNSELTAGKLLSVDAGRDWGLSGAKATGETVLARVGSKGAGSLSIVRPIPASPTPWAGTETCPGAGAPQSPTGSRRRAEAVPLRRPGQPIKPRGAATLACRAWR